MKIPRQVKNFMYEFDDQYFLSDDLDSVPVELGTGALKAENFIRS